MTRLLVISDTQIGVQTVDLADQQAVLEQAVQLALAHEVDAVLHAGDVFEGRSEGNSLVTPEQTRMFIDATEPLRDEGIPIVVLRGNGVHDSAKRKVHALDVLREIDGFHVCDRPSRKTYAGIWITALPWVSPDRLIAQYECDIDHDSVNEAVSRLLVKIARDLGPYGNDDHRVTDQPHVLLAHWAISGSELPSGLSADEMREPVLPWADLDALGYDLIVAGHLHYGQRLDNPELGDRTVGIVPGSPQPLNHGEGHYDHGVWLVSLEDGEVDAEFVPLASRRFVTVGLLGPDELPDDDITDAYVRVRYEISEQDAHEIDTDHIRRTLMGAGAYRVDTRPTIVRERRARAADIGDTHDDPLAALAAYCEAEGVTEGLRDRMVQTLKEWQ